MASTKVYNTDKIQAAFDALAVPETLQLCQGVFISDLPKCIKSHINYIKGKSVGAYTVYYDRLQNIYKLIK